VQIQVNFQAVLHLFSSFLSFLFYFLSALKLSFYVTQAGLKLIILLPPSLECWNYRYVSPFSVALSVFLVSQKKDRCREDGNEAATKFGEAWRIKKTFEKAG
jgi:hypothetical protein